MFVSPRAPAECRSWRRPESNSPQACYWTTIPKNRSTYHPSRGVREDEIAEIIQQEVIVNKDLDAGETKLLATDGIRRFANALKTEKEKEDFRRHLRRYLQIYMPDCPWEVNTTNRYTIVTHEAAITARRYIRRNESIKYLSGIQVIITPEEEKDMALRRKDFSIVVSSRNKCASLFMGPARFANHDCGANAKLVTTGHAGIEIIATRDIEAGDEITVTYGENYFGEDNCECLCKTCEDMLRNGWAPEDGSAPVAAVRTSVEEEKSDSYSLRRRRRDDSIGGSSRTSSVTPLVRPRVLKTRPKSSRLGSGRDSTAVDSPAPDMRTSLTPHGRKRPVDALASPPITPAKKLKYTPDPAAAETASRSSSTSRCESSSTPDAVGTDITTPEKESPEPVMPTPVKDSVGLESKEESGAASKPQEEETHADGLNTKDMSIRSILNASAENREPQEVAPIALSIETVEDEAAPAEATPPTKQRKKWTRKVFIKQSTPPARRHRVPGDYTLTPLLLSEPAMAWIQCSVCPTYFVQQNAYVTRSACPRCERHARLYGYIWPKTDKAGPSDKEERILDHRTIHPFLSSRNERKVRGRKPIKGDTDSEDENEEEEAAAERPRGRQMKRGRPSLKKGPGRSKVLESSHGESESDAAGVRRSGRARRVSSRLADC